MTAPSAVTLCVVTHLDGKPHVAEALAWVDGDDERAPVCRQCAFALLANGWRVQPALLEVRE